MGPPLKIHVISSNNDLPAHFLYQIPKNYIGKTALLIHGFRGDSINGLGYSKLREILLVRGYSVISLNHSGSDHYKLSNRYSQKPDSVTVTSQLEDIKTILDCIHGDLTVIGHSAGTQPITSLDIEKYSHFNLGQIILFSPFPNMVPNLIQPLFQNPSLMKDDRARSIIEKLNVNMYTKGYCMIKTSSFFSVKLTKAYFEDALKYDANSPHHSLRKIPLTIIRYQGDTKAKDWERNNVVETWITQLQKPGTTNITDHNIAGIYHDVTDDLLKIFQRIVPEISKHVGYARIPRHC